MDENYKSFVGWTKSVLGKEYIRSQDANELNSLRGVEGK
jgi:rRNA pseudouridine-1189 N-methylase Emg1 (Nep1/Mra1 family)